MSGVSGLVCFADRAVACRMTEVPLASEFCAMLRSISKDGVPSVVVGEGLEVGDFPFLGVWSEHPGRVNLRLGQFVAGQHAGDVLVGRLPPPNGDRESGQHEVSRVGRRRADRPGFVEITEVQVDAAGAEVGTSGFWSRSSQSESLSNSPQTQPRPYAGSVSLVKHGVRSGFWMLTGPGPLSARWDIRVHPVYSNPLAMPAIVARSACATCSSSPSRSRARSSACNRCRGSR